MSAEEMLIEEIAATPLVREEIEGYFGDEEEDEAIEGHLVGLAMPPATVRAIKQYAANKSGRVARVMAAVAASLFARSEEMFKPNRTMGLGVGAVVTKGTPLVIKDSFAKDLTLTENMVVCGVYAAVQTIEEKGATNIPIGWIVKAGSFLMGNDIAAPVQSDMPLSALDPRNFARPGGFKADFAMRVVQTGNNNPITAPVSIDYVTPEVLATRVFGGLFVDLWDPRCIKDKQTSGSWLDPDQVDIEGLSAKLIEKAKSTGLNLGTRKIDPTARGSYAATRLDPTSKLYKDSTQKIAEVRRKLLSGR